ncbi:hypothetical protein AMATHDRAFT_87663 [Amanita thiersii Skay4041]|uniref:Acid phosphatase n=1 Tax=Amanita thiersii Skay4041 TaxID=703135 RepID=A0A2A9NH52_9AGAR|nr:hypothetical protein AMATHDRAFT_87663 [Amanita thiersii Skay4041]
MPSSQNFGLFASHQWFVLSLASFGLVRAAAPYFPPRQTTLNNLTFVLNGSGAPGIFNSSETPAREYGVYNWCNMPHVRVREYKTPPKEFALEYVEVIQRHHKRTPYASNTFFKENIEWDCVGSGPVYGAIVEDEVGGVEWQAYTDSQNPFTNTVGPGFVNSSCQNPQITTQGLDDAFEHGRDLHQVYFPRLSLGPSFDSSHVLIRVTNNPITSQIATSLIRGLFPSLSTRPIPVAIQKPPFDSLEPTYPCPAADALRSGYASTNSGDKAAGWVEHLERASDVYDALGKVSGIEKNDSGGWHVSFDHYYDNLSAKECHAKSLPCSVNDTSVCVSRELVDTVYRLGNWEYSYIFRDAPDSAAYSAMHYGAWVKELKGRLEDKMVGKNNLRYVHNVAHDGSIAPLLGFLQIAEMVWPGMGSEIIFELYSQSKSHFIRVLWGGQPIETSLPLGSNKSGVLDMVPIQEFFDFCSGSSTVGVADIDSMIATDPNALVNTCRQST